MKPLFFALLVILVAKPLSAQKATQDYQSVYSTVSNYFIGWENKDTNLLNKIFHSSSTLKYIDQRKEFQNMAIDQHIRDITAPSASFLPPHVRAVSNIEVFEVGASAVVKLRFKTFEVTDFFQLLKINEEWKIVSKVSVSKVLSKEITGK